MMDAVKCIYIKYDILPDNNNNNIKINILIKFYFVIICEDIYC